MTIKSALVILVGVGCALPALADDVLAPSGGACSATDDIQEDARAYRPLQVEQRLFFDLTNVSGQLLEIQYFVQDAHRLTEVVDLSAAKLPTNLNQTLGSTGSPEMDRDGDRPLVMELLAFRPDLVRQLHELLESGARIDIQVVDEDGTVNLVSFEELTRGSAELLSSRMLLLVVAAAVESVVAERHSGDGDIQPVQSSCPGACFVICNQSTPCGTSCEQFEVQPPECGPITTCGEMGEPCDPGTPPTCQCETVLDTSWTPWEWLNFGRYAIPPGEHVCIVNVPWVGGGWWRHQSGWTIKRRDRVQRVRICPNCPLCAGCFTEDRVIDTQIMERDCWMQALTGPTCGSGDRSLNFLVMGQDVCGFFSPPI